MKDVKQFFKIAPILLSNIRTGLVLSGHRSGYELGNTTQNFQRLMSVLAPLKDINPSITFYMYGNSLFEFLYVFPNRTQLYFTTKEKIYVSSYNEFYEPMNTTLYSKIHWPVYWKGLALMSRIKTFPDYGWTDLFVSFVSQCTCVGAYSKVIFQTRNGQQVREGIGVFYDIHQLNKLLYYRVIVANSNMQTKSTQIVIVERNGMLVSNSEDLTTCITHRIHLSAMSEHFALVSQWLLKEKMLVSTDTNYTTLPKTDQQQNQQRSVMHVNGIRVSAEPYQDGHGLDLLVIVSTAEHGFVKVILTSSPIVFSVSIILMVLGTVCMFIFTQLTTRALLKVARNMFNISNMQIYRVNYSKFLNMIFELKLLQSSCRAVQRVQVGFSKYIPKEIIREIIVSNDEGTTFCMKHIETTLMFTDIADFTNLSESISISSLIEVLSQYFTIVTHCVERNGGIIDKFIGDGTMSIFSHPLSILGHHSGQACRSALESLSGIEKLNTPRSMNHHLPRIGIRIGINTGLAAIGNIGSIDRLNYTAIGDSVNTASRLESLCKRYNLQVLIGESTYEEVKNQYVCFFVDTVKLKGKDRPIDIYLIETEWTKSNVIQKQVHDSLLEVRNHLRSHQFQLLIEKVNFMKDFLHESMEESPILSNLGFLQMLVERVGVLVAVEMEQNDDDNGIIDHALTLTEK